ncbi:hypothetical protein C8A01DRAFT_47442 [Parachaetomium inaequale]|uniref:Uncharacterized protein n=1 Tax=Parachaetomium inaequale TaxID=2588326 RepID=A0AAN6PDP0_9PEZI|nr:hypothetical protein C8A01DRAFT_47442 [Parachaetomium inaequale]
MKFAAVAAAATLALAPGASAWRVYLYSFTDFSGSTYTAAGPGGTGTACHVIPSDHRYQANSIEYYAYNSQTSPTTRCKLQLWESTDCSGNQGPFFSVDTKKALVEDWRNRAASFSTTCWAV